MKIVLRHHLTGRYYDGAGSWVRRADNAQSFDSLSAAREFCRAHHLELEVQPVQRLAPYMRDLLRAPHQPIWASWEGRRADLWYATRLSRFSEN